MKIKIRIGTYPYSTQQFVHIISDNDKDSRIHAVDFKLSAEIIEVDDMRWHLSDVNRGEVKDG